MKLHISHSFNVFLCLINIEKRKNNFALNFSFFKHHRFQTLSQSLLFKIDLGLEPMSVKPCLYVTCSVSFCHVRQTRPEEAEEKWLLTTNYLYSFNSTSTDVLELVAMQVASAAD